MPRARNIKPGFFTNEELVELPFETRLLFIALWTLADRDGRLEDRPKRIKMQSFPADDVDVDDGLEQLAAAGFIVRYRAEGVRCIQVVNWDKHQNPHVKEAPSGLPEPGQAPDSTPVKTANAPDEHHASTVQAPDEHHASPADSLIPDSSLLPERARARGKRREMVPDGWQPSPQTREWFAKQPYRFSIDDMTDEFVNGCRAKNHKYADHDAAFRNWAKKRHEANSRSGNRSAETAAERFSRRLGIA